MILKLFKNPEESKIYIGLYFTLILFTSVVSAQIGRDFKHPWLNPETPIIIDAFYKNPIDWVEMGKDKRVAGILHKATEGTDKTDPEYLNRRKTAREKGYKWGSYHLLRKGETIAQAEFYLKLVGVERSDELLALDVECTENTACSVPQYGVTFDEIKTFIEHIRKRTGRYPLLYANQTVVRDLTENFPDTDLLKRVPLWYARFKPEVTDFPAGIWQTYTFWQFSSEINCQSDQTCLYRVPGTLSDMDVNVYNGTHEELKSNWAEIGR